MEHNSIRKSWETEPYKNLKELYDDIENPSHWPSVVRLRETRDYVYKGVDTASFHNDEKLIRSEQPKTLVCHDMKGGYLEDRLIYGSVNYKSYSFYHWAVIDIFVYFSHHFVTIPPHGWVNAAHNHGVKVLGTVITENTHGSEIWKELLQSRASIIKFADALVMLANRHEFEGWLLNVENIIEQEQVSELEFFVKYLTDKIHTVIPYSEIIWYDSVTKKGKLEWQNQLNNENKEFFSNCDGIFLNYKWTNLYLEESGNMAKKLNRKVNNVYVGLDVWGRGCPGGGRFNSAYALDIIRRYNLSVAIFAPGWTFEYFGFELYLDVENIFWAQLYEYLYVHVPVYRNETLDTSFCYGAGNAYYLNGEVQLDVDYKGRELVMVDKPFFNLLMQKPQLSFCLPLLKFTNLNTVEHYDSSDTSLVIEHLYESKKHKMLVVKDQIIFEKKPLNSNCIEYCNTFCYQGGRCLKVYTHHPDYYHRIFSYGIEFDNMAIATVVYMEYDTDIIRRGILNQPILVLRNEKGIRTVVCSRTVVIKSNWKKCIYPTNMTTIEEVGIKFDYPSVCYIGEIAFRQAHYHSQPDSAPMARRILPLNG